MEDNLILEIKPQFSFFTANEIFRKKYETKRNKSILLVYRIIILTIYLLIFYFAYFAYNNISQEFKNGLKTLGGFENILIAATVISLIAGVTIGIGITVATIIYSKKERYKETTYKIFKNKIDFIEDYPVERRRSLNLSDIGDIELSQTNYQKKHNFGTIFFKLKNKPENPNIAQVIYTNTCFTLANIENPQFVYAKLKELINGQGA